MSWIESKDEATRSDVEALALQHEPMHAPAETREQFEAAKHAAIGIIDSGAVGAGPFKVVISGHARTDHEAAGQYEAAEVIGVQVSRTVKE
jgi:hypothetical protein